MLPLLFLGRSRYPQIFEGYSRFIHRFLTNLSTSTEVLPHSIASDVNLDLQNMWGIV